MALRWKLGLCTHLSIRDSGVQSPKCCGPKVVQALGFYVLSPLRVVSECCSFWLIKQKRVHFRKGEGFDKLGRSQWGSSKLGAQGSGFDNSFFVSEVRTVE